MKKLLSLILSLTIILSCVSVVSFSTSATMAAIENNPCIRIETVKARAGETVRVKVILENNPGIWGMDIKIGYDKSQLTLANVINGEIFADGEWTKGNLAGEKYTLSYAANDFVDITTNGTLAVLEFTVNENAIVDTLVEITGSYNLGDITNMNFDDIEVTIVSGGVNVIDFIYGDLNGDSLINKKDDLLMRMYLADQNTVIDMKAADVFYDGMVNKKDLLLLKQHLAGWIVEFGPKPGDHAHTLTAVAYKAPTCTETGNEAYWHCTSCGKYYSDENAKTETTLNDSVISATGHSYSNEWSFDQTYHWHTATCEHTNLVNDKAEHIYGNDNICDVCSMANTPDPTKPYEITYELYEYDQNKGDTYLPTAYIDNSMNPTYYSSADRFDLKNPICAGYEFLGWFTVDGIKITQIEEGTNKNLLLQARWNPIEYDIVYRLFKTPVEDSIKAEYKKYTVNKGLVDMPNPEIYNYIFLGWYTDDGVEVTNIPAGTTGDIALNAFFVSKRNLAKTIEKIDDPIILENTDEGVIYFAYEIGTIENVPLATLETYENIVGLKQIVSKEYTWSVSNTRSEEISDTISKATVDSGTWAWSENWSDVLEVSEEWAEEHQMTKEEAKEAIKTTNNSYSNTYSEGGQKGTNDTNGTTTLDYNSKEETDTESTKITAKMEVSASTNYLGTKFEVNGSLSGTQANSNETKTHTGTDTTKVNTVVTEESSSWNDETTSEYSVENSTSESVKNAFSEIISNTKGYGQTYAKGGEGSESFGSSTTESNTFATSSTMTFTTAESQTTTTTIEIDAATMKEGSYRLTIGGTMHVFAIVGYDIANKSYFHYTFNVMDDDVKTFFDYSCDNSFKDNEYSVIPFEIPYFVHEYVSNKVVVTEGVEYKTDSTTGTATILQYTGESTDVLIPTYISAGGIAYKVNKISSSAFAGNKSIKTVILSEYINEIPDGAFKGCTSLEEVSGYYTKIGREAFSGCEKLKTFNIPSTVSEIGENAFNGVIQINVVALSADNALAIAKANIGLEALDTEIKTEAQAITKKLINAVVTSGAKNITIDISQILSGTKLKIEVPSIDSFELTGGKNTYTDLSVNSNAYATKFVNLIINNSTDCFFNIASQNVTFNAVSITSEGTTLVLPYDGAQVALQKDTRLSSNSGTTIVCKNATFNSQKVDGVIGTLDISGNIYVVGKNGNITEETHPYFVTVENGKVIEIEEEDFEGFAKGMVTITYDANGGIVDISHTSLVFGSQITEMPIPEWDRYTFLGWFDENGTEIKVGDTLNYTSDVTLKARWKSGYVLESDVPVGFEIVADSEKWTYDLTTNITSDKSSVDGYTLYDTTFVWGDTVGPFDYDPSDGIRNVWSEQRIDSTTKHYKYYHRTNGTIFGSDSSAPGYSRHSIDITQELPYYETGSTGINWHSGYSCPHCGQHYRWIFEGTYDENHYSTIWYYQDPIYTYYFTKTESLESATEVVETEAISNIQKWVQYVVK